MAKLAVTSAEKTLYDQLLASASEDPAVVKSGGLKVNQFVRRNINELPSPSPYSLTPFNSHSPHPTHRQCQRDSTLKKFTSKIAAVASTDAKTFLVLEDTIFFPTGGGQPYDTGKLVWGADDSCSCSVLGATTLKGINVIALKNPPPGLEVGICVTQHLDWSRRWYHTQSHTSQHILSACALLHDIDTHSWDLNESGVSVDFKGANIEKVRSCEEHCYSILLVASLPVG